jgi:hypothetical protein
MINKHTLKRKIICESSPDHVYNVNQNYNYYNDLSDKHCDSLQLEISSDPSDPSDPTDPNDPNDPPNNKRSKKNFRKSNKENKKTRFEKEDEKDNEKEDEKEQKRLEEAERLERELREINEIIQFNKQWNYNEEYYTFVNFPCENPLCDHKIHLENWEEENKILITTVNTIDDLINLGDCYHCKMRTEYNGIDMKILFKLKSPLTELNQMVGLGQIKSEIVNTIIYFLLSKNLNKEINSDMMHAVITGSPGCGKTTFVEILSKIYVGLGVLKKGHIVKTKRSELIGKFLGHTAVQTQKKIEEAHGGILLIDEAYSLGNPEGRDSFAKECLDTLNQALSEQKSDFICIIAGYKNALDTSFFSYNEGLKRRFPFRYDIEKYTPDELSMILLKKIETYGCYGVNKEPLWKIEFTKKQLENLIKENYKYFKNQGGDMESIFLGAKILQNKRVFLLSVEEKKKILLGDIKNSIDKFIQLHKLKENHDDFMVKSMYI